MRTEKADDLISDSCRSVLVLLVKEGPRTLGELSDHERVKPPSMNQTVNVLEEFGFLQRRDDPTDGRKVILEATPSGRAFIEETRRRLHAWLQARLVELSGEERRILGEAALIIGRLADS
jgi:DNA-binding MarR family transcriptional regulator